MLLRNPHKYTSAKLLIGWSEYHSTAVEPSLHRYINWRQLRGTFAKANCSSQSEPIPHHHRIWSNAHIFIWPLSEILFILFTFCFFTKQHTTEITKCRISGLHNTRAQCIHCM